MSIFFSRGDTDSRAFRSWIEQAVSTEHEDPTSRDLTRLFATSVVAHRAGLKRADAVSLVPMVIKDKAGEPISETRPIVKTILRNYRETMRRSELTMCFWGRNLIQIRRAITTMPYELRWVNPNLFTLEYSTKGLKGFRIMRSSRAEYIDVSYLKRGDAVYLNEIDFNNDFDGISAVEVAFRYAQLSVDMPETQVAFFRNRAIPSAIVQPASGTTPNGAERSDEAERTRLQKLLSSFYKGPANAGRTLLQRFRWEWIKLQADFDDVKFETHYEQAAEGVAMGFDMPVSLIRESASNFAQQREVRLDWAQSWVAPRVAWYAEQLTEQVLTQPIVVKRYGELVCVPDFSKVAMMKEDQTALITRVNSQVQGGYRDLFSAAVEAGVKDPAEELKGMYMWSGVPTPISAISQLWQSKLPAPAPVMDSNVPQADIAGAANPDGANRDATLLEQPKPPAQPVINGREVAVMIGVQNDPNIIDLQRKAGQLYKDKPIKWNQPDTLHVTMIYGPAASDEQIRALQSALEQIELPEDMSMKIGRLDSFDNVGSHALHFRVSKTGAMSELQQEIFDLCQMCSLAVGGNHQPESFIPHVTMGYADEKLPPVMYHGKAKVKPVDLQLSVDHVVVYRRDWKPQEQPPEPPAKKTTVPLPDEQFKELKDWQNILNRKGRDHVFAFKALSEQAVQWIGQALDLGYDLPVIFEATRSGFTDHQYKPLADAAEVPLIMADWKQYAVQAAKSFSDTSSQFVGEMKSIIGKGQADETTKRKFAGGMRSALRRFGLIAFRDGMNDAGYDPESLSAEELATFRAWQDEQTSLVGGLANEIFKQGISENEVNLRAQMWADVSLRSIYMKGVVTGNNLVPMKWTLGQAVEQHCTDCPRLAGQVRTAAFWDKADLHPGSLKTECMHGCKCDLVVTNEPLSKGKLPRLVGGRADGLAEETELDIRWNRLIDPEELELEPVD